MATVKLVKGKKGQKAGGGAAKKGDFQLQDNQDGTYTVNGVDAAGVAVDISSVATLAAQSDNPAVLTADVPAGMTGAVHGLTPGAANLTITATWNDGSSGPFVITVPVAVTTSPAQGIKVDFGTPTVR